MTEAGAQAIADRLELERGGYSANELAEGVLRAALNSRAPLKIRRQVEQQVFAVRRRNLANCVTNFLMCEARYTKVASRVSIGYFFKL
jgi:hypothetical protein